jgi:SCP1.201-like deaminase
MRAEGGPGTGYNPVTRTHVEGAAAQVMRENGITQAVLTIDHPGGVCPYCNTNLPSMLEPGSQLTVETPVANDVIGPTKPGWVRGNPTYCGKPAPR